MTTAQSTRLQTQQLTSSIGALIEGVDLRQPLERHVIDEIWKTFLDSGVIFFRNQDLDDAQMEAFVAQFGTPIAEPAADIDTTIVSQTDMSVNKIGTAIWHRPSTRAMRRGERTPHDRPHMSHGWTIVTREPR